MSALSARFLTIAGLTGSLVLGVSTASGAPNDGPKDGEALALVKKAIDTDYLGTKFADAEKKLSQALKLCGPAAACSAKVRAQVLVNLGIVYIGGMSRVDDGKARFIEALKQDPSVTPNPDLVSPEIESAFAEAKHSGGKAEPGPTTPTPTPTPPVAPVAPTGGNGDLVHTPPTEDATLTPLPIYAELPAGQVAARMQLSYKPFGATEWKSLAMKSTGKGYGVEVPCVEIGSAPGDLAYFIQAFDGDNNLVSWSGSRNAPNKVAIKVTLDGEQPHLPGQPPPARCPDTGDCPPEFPGCKGAKTDEAPPCEPGTECTAPAAQSVGKKNWLTLAVQMDFLLLPASNAACAGGWPTMPNGPPTNSANYTCFQGSTYYAGVPYTTSGDAVTGGPVFSTVRILAGYDRALGNFTVGARLGAAFNGGPTTPATATANGKSSSFLPLHAEGRAAFWFGHDPFARTGLRPYVVVNGGVADVDGKVTALVYNGCPTATVSCAGYSHDYANNIITPYNAWQRAGAGFVGGGIGALLAVKPNTGPLLELKFMELLGSGSGTTAPAFNLQVGWALGL
jgi:hypothetical protein